MRRRLRTVPVAALASELVGASEACELLGISTSALVDRRRPARYRAKPELPAPVADLKCGPVWLRSDLEAYREAWNRAPGTHAHAGRWA
jgi:hypothetical protein